MPSSQSFLSVLRLLPWGLLDMRGWIYSLGFPDALDGKESSCNAGDGDLSLGQEDPLEKEMATHSSILAWRIPWTEEPDGL